VYRIPVENLLHEQRHQLCKQRIICAADSLFDGVPSERTLDTAERLLWQLRAARMDKRVVVLDRFFRLMLSSDWFKMQRTFLEMHHNFESFLDELIRNSRLTPRAIRPTVGDGKSKGRWQPMPKMERKESSLWGFT